MAKFASIDAMRAAVGTELGVGEWIKIGQGSINTFAALTHDEQWVHVDVERAAASPLGTTIVHGYFTLALLAPSVMDLISIEGAEQYLNYGMNRVRFPSSVPSGARVRGRLTLESVTEQGSGYLVTVKAVMEVEGQEKPGCVAEVLTFVEF